MNTTSHQARFFDWDGSEITGDVEAMTARMWQLYDMNANGDKAAAAELFRISDALETGWID